MLISYLLGTGMAEGSLGEVEGAVPDVFALQALIEEAWEAEGVETEGKVETDGILGTRKFIGTPEVCVCDSVRKCP